MTRLPRLVRVGSCRAVKHASLTRATSRAIAAAARTAEFPRGREDRRRPIRRPCSHWGGRDAGHHDSCPCPGQPGGASDRCSPRNQANARLAPVSIRVAIGAPCRKAGRDRRRGFQRLLIERLAAPGAVAEALRADRPEQACRCGLQRHEPTQGSQAGLDIAAALRSQVR